MLVKSLFQEFGKSGRSRGPFGWLVSQKKLSFLLLIQTRGSEQLDSFSRKTSLVGIESIGICPG